MFFAILVLISAFLIEGIGTFISTVGLASLFSGSPVIIVLAVALDFGKVVGVSFLYKYFNKINLLMKVYMTVAVTVLMMITSAGAFGFLSKSFQSAIQGTNQNNIIISSLTDEQAKLQKRKEEIDTQIAKLPDNSVSGRRKLMASFGPEVDKINSRLEEIDKQLPQLKVESIQKNTEVGPIIYIAQAFNTDPEHAVKWVILIIIFVFDPLAVSLLLAGNFLLEERKKLPELPVQTINAQVPDVQPPEPSPKYYKRDYPTGFESYVDSLPKEPEPERFGYHRYKEKPVELFDHLTKADLGNTKPRDRREIISLEQVLQPPKPRSKLENIDNNGNELPNYEGI